MLRSKILNITKTLKRMESTMQRPIQEAIERKLKDKFQPTYLEVINESHKHAVPKNLETHFKVVVVSDHFKSMPLLQRHRLINGVVAYELENGVHALSIQSKTESEWTSSGGKTHQTPPCHHK